MSTSARTASVRPRWPIMTTGFSEYAFFRNAFFSTFERFFFHGKCLIYVCVELYSNIAVGGGPVSQLNKSRQRPAGCFLLKSKT